MATNTASQPNDIYSIVATTRGKYFGTITKTDNGIAIASAYEIKQGEDNDANKLARAYMKAELYGDTKRLELSSQLVESVSEATNETRLLRTIRSLLPDAEKRALGVVTYQALETMLAGTASPSVGR